MNRRHFLAAILAAGAAPAFVRAGSLMRINPAIVSAAPAIQWAVVDGFRFIEWAPIAEAGIFVPDEKSRAMRLAIEPLLRSSQFPPPPEAWGGIEAWLARRGLATA